MMNRATKQPAGIAGLLSALNEPQFFGTAFWDLGPSRFRPETCPLCTGYWLH